MNKILGYRKMVSMTQKQMADEIGISENQYRAKEKGQYDFTRTEMQSFYKVIKKDIPDIQIQDIFFE